ncbi:MAG: hypothetical protein K9J21_12545 [Bacteroidales bacterium]|nr:hypothetical protein [Bacteroidales bacterium]
MIKGGYYIKARKIQNSEIANAPPHVREIWDWLIKEANHKEKKIHGNIFKRGELIRSYRDIQEGLHWMVGFRKEKYSKWQCEMAMKWLTKRQMITTTKTTRGMIITVCNYDYYQNPENYESHKGSHNKATTKPQGTDTINKNEKNAKNDKKKEEDKILLSQVDVSTLNDRDKKNYQVAISFWELVKSNLSELDIKSPATEKATYKLWVDPIRLLIEKDKRTIEEFREIFIFLQQDEFWKEQIRSTAKLRKKNKENITYFEVLLTKARNEQRKQKRSGNNQSGVSEDYRRSILERLRNPKNSETVKEG